MLYLTSPLNHFFCAIVVAWICYFFQQKKLGRICAIVGFSWLLLCSQYWFSSWLLAPIEHQYQPYNINSPDLADIEQIFVLAGYYESRSTLPDHTRWPNASYKRNTTALFLHEKLQAPILITGGNFLSDKQVSYSEFSKAFFLDKGVAEEALIAVPQGHNTFTEISAVAEHLNKKRTLIISSATHIPRIKLFLEQVTPQADYVFFPVEYLSKKQLSFVVNPPALYALRSSQRAIYEYLALTYYTWFMPER